MYIRHSVFSRVHVDIMKRDLMRAIDNVNSSNENVIRVFGNQRGMRLSEVKSDAIPIAISIMEDLEGLGCDPTNCSVRIRDPDGSYSLGWHQDYASVGIEALNPEFYKKYENKLVKVAWIPLDPIDGTRPTLEVAEPEDPREHHRDAMRFLVADELKDREGQVIKGMEPGDVLLFSPYAPHRSYSSPGMTNTRLSIDLRFCERAHP
jgi:ectoine hydroxylase-related dioxygenase (phytanoyl-CoA dioxygenase family)